MNLRGFRRERREAKAIIAVRPYIRGASPRNAPKCIGEKAPPSELLPRLEDLVRDGVDQPDGRERAADLCGNQTVSRVHPIILH